MQKVTFIMGSVFPVPATKGGAVENLIENIVKIQENQKKIELNIICAYDFDAKKIAKEKYKNTKFYFIKINKFFKIFDRVISFFVTKILRKKNVMAYSYIFQRLSYYRKISKILSREDCGKIILENSTGLYLALKWKNNYKKYKNKFFYHCHNKVNMDFGCKDIIEQTNKFISVSKYMQDDLKLFTNINDNNRFFVLKNMIDRVKFDKEKSKKKKQKIKQKYNIMPDDKIIIFVGRLTEEKGIKQLLLAIDTIKNATIKILIVGSYFFNTKVRNDFINEIDKIIDRNREKIIFTGYINYDDIYKYYKIADIAVLPSMWEEPAGLTIQEAEVCGLPIITTYSGGIPEYVNNDNAIILNRDDSLIDNLKISIEMLLEDNDKRNKMKNSSLEIGNKISITDYYNDFIKIINSL